MYKIVEGYVVEPRKTWFEGDEYEMSYEIIDQKVFFHLLIDKPSKRVIRDIKEKLLELKLKLYSLGFEHLFSYTKDDRMIRLIGGDVIGEWNGNKVIAWELN